MSESTDDGDFRYYFGMLVRHPSLDLSSVLLPLGMRPDSNAVAGQPRMTPIGRSLPGVYRESFWSWRRLVEGNRKFMTSASDLANELQPHRALLSGVVDSGGSVSITLQLPSNNNLGSTLHFSELSKISNLKINLGIEFFSDTRNFARPVDAD